MFGEENVEKTDGRTVFIGRRSIDGDVVASGSVARETDVNGRVVEKRTEQTRDEEERLERRNRSGDDAALRQPTFAPKSIENFVKRSIGADMVKSRPMKRTRTSTTGSMRVE